ncbi:MAG: single-stranded DNA-binding protein [Candidatus Neomarinimicrobiota bacterium]
MALSKGSINKVILVGHLGRDPEVRYTPSGDAVAEVSLATTESVKNKDGKREDRTEWHSLVIWRNQAEFAKEWLKKGQLVYIEGRLQTRQWEDKEGQKRSRTDIQVDQITMLGGSGRAREKDTAESEAPAASPPDDEIPF